MNYRSEAVLITGCSTGIGRATAERLAAAGHTIYATARNESSIEDLEDLGCRTLALDGLEYLYQVHQERIWFPER